MHNYCDRLVSMLGQRCGAMAAGPARCRQQLAAVSPQRRDVFGDGLFLVLKRSPLMCAQYATTMWPANPCSGSSRGFGWAAADSESDRGCTHWHRFAIAGGSIDSQPIRGDGV